MVRLSTLIMLSLCRCPHSKLVAPETCLQWRLLFSIEHGTVDGYRKDGMVREQLHTAALLDCGNVQ